MDPGLFKKHILHLKAHDKAKEEIIVLLQKTTGITLSEEEIEDVIICLNDLGYIEVVDKLKE